MCKYLLSLYIQAKAPAEKLSKAFSKTLVVIISRKVKIKYEKFRWSIFTIGESVYSIYQKDDWYTMCYYYH